MKAFRIGKYVLAIGHFREAREAVLSMEHLSEELAENRRHPYDKLRAKRLLEIARPIDEAMVRAEEAHVAKTIPTVRRG